MDGWAGARTDLGASPSVSIANGAPTGANATNEIIDAWSDAPSENHEVTDVSFGTNGGSAWSSPQPVSLSGDRPIYSAPAIAPDGSKAYVIYEADTAPFATDFASPRPYHGVFLSSPLDSSGTPTGWTPEFNEPPTGDLRATYPGHDMYQERIGDYIYAAASNDYGVGLWISAINTAVCPAIQTGGRRRSLRARNSSRRRGRLPRRPTDAHRTGATPTPTPPRPVSRTRPPRTRAVRGGRKLLR